MALPEVNRARIEKLNIDVTGVKHDIESILGDIDNIDPIILDENFPNIIPPAPSNVIASALFRNIQVSWSYDNASYIAEYEAHASQSPNFHTSNDTVVWRGMSGGFNHKASVGETWYFKVRIKNRHGEYSSFSEEVSAMTVDISDFEIDEQYKIDLVEYTNQYTDERKDEVLGVVAGKLDAQVYHDNIILKANIIDVEEDFQIIESDISSLDDKIELRVTRLEYDADINDGENGLFARVSEAESNITALDSEISLRVTESELDTRMGDVVHRFEQNESDITINSKAITNRVTHTEYDALTTRVSTAEGSVETLAGEVSLKASSTDLEGVEGRLSTAESTLSVLPTSIESKVEKDGVISAIKQSPESLKIDVALVDINGDLKVENGLTRLKDAIIDKVHIKDSAIVGRMLADDVITNRMIAGNASIDFAKIGNVHITSAMIGELHADKLTAGVLNIERIPHLTADKLTIGSSTSFASGYNPADKVDGSYVQTAIDGVEIGGVNLLVEKDITRSRYLKNDGSTVSSGSWFHTDYIPVNGIKNLVASGYTNLGSSPSVVYYNANKAFVKGINNAGRSRGANMVIDSGIHYIRFSGEVRDLGTLKIEKGTKPSNYSPAPEDVDAQIGSVDTKAGTAQSTANTAQSTASSANSKAINAQSRVGTVEGRINNAVTTIDGAGVTVRDGNFYLEDGSSGKKSLAVTKRNMIRDPLMDTLRINGAASTGQNVFYASRTGSANEYSGWNVRNSVRMYSMIEDFGIYTTSKSLFGMQSALLNNTGNIYQYVRLERSKKYTISFHVNRNMEYTSGGIPRLQIIFKNSNLSNLSTLSKNFSSVTNANVVRHSYTFTTPSTFDLAEIRFTGGSARWYMLGGIQLVEGEYMAPFIADEDMSYFKASGSKAYMLSAETFNGDTIYVDNGLFSGLLESNNLTAPSGYRLKLGAGGTEEVVSIYGNGNVLIPDGLLNIANGIGHIRAGYFDATQTSNTSGYFGVNTRLRVTDGGFWGGSTSGTNFREVQASNFNTVSLVEKKKNIKPIGVRGLDVINESDLYEYNFKEDDDSVMRYGLVIGEGYRTPKEILDSEGESISQYDMNTFSWLAIQELSQEFDELKHLTQPTVKDLVEDNKNLKRQVDTLYGRMEVLENKESV